MGTSFKKAIFDEHIQEGLVGWARKAKKNRRNAANGSTQVGHKEDSPILVQLANVNQQNESSIEQGNGNEITSENNGTNGFK